MGKTIRETRAASQDDPALVALCFKVPLKFRRWFKMEALKRDVTMTELLVRAVERYATLSVPDE